MAERITSLDEIENPEAFLNAYYKAMDEAKDFREENKRLTAELEDKSDDAADRWKMRALVAEAKVALEEQGVKDADRIVKRLNLENVDFDDDGNLTGFDESVSEFKADFPELFDTKKRAGRNSADIHENKPAQRELSPSEQQAAALYG